MFRRVLNYIETHVNFGLFREDSRKLGVNLLTAGIVGLFITNIGYLDHAKLLGAVWVLAIGLSLIIIGISRRNKS